MPRAPSRRGAGGRCGRWGLRGSPSGCARCRSTTPEEGRPRAPCRGWPACPRACGPRCVRLERARCRRSRSRGTPADEVRRSRPLQPAGRRRTPRSRTCRPLYRRCPSGPWPHGPARMPRVASGNGERDSGPCVELDRDAWAALGESTEQPLTAEEIERVRGLGDELDLDEVRQVYLPMSRLLSLYVGSAGALHRAQEEFLNQPQPPRTPFVIGLAGSVAVGKSTTARVLQQMLAHWPEHPSVALVTTDGFLHPNSELQRRGLMARKGFP